MVVFLSEGRPRANERLQLTSTDLLSRSHTSLPSITEHEHRFPGRMLDDQIEEFEVQHAIESVFSTSMSRVAIHQSSKPSSQPFYPLLEQKEGKETRTSVKDTF